MFDTVILQRFIDKHVIDRAGSYLIPEKVVEILILFSDITLKTAQKDDLIRTAHRLIGKKYQKKMGWVEKVQDEKCDKCDQICQIQYDVCYQNCALKVGDKIWEYLGEYQECCSKTRG